MIKKIATSLGVMALVLAACQAQAVDERPTTTSTTTASPTTQAETGATSSPMRVVDTVQCEEAGEDVVIVCEAYDLIQRHYVDDIEDSALAEAAKLALVSEDPPVTSSPLSCAIPAQAFIESCETAAGFNGDDKTAAEAILTGFTSYALDPNSAYFDKAALELLEQEQEGEIEGIGALVSPEDPTIEGENKQCAIVSETCRISIVSTIEGAPAEGAGLLKDDVIVGVDGESILGWTIDEVTSRVRGPAGTDVTLTIERESAELDVTITRAAVEIPVLESATFGDAGYIRLSVFSQTADEQFERAVVALLGEDVSSLVIDLRNNPGGLLDTAIAVTSVFLPDGDVVVTEGPGERTSYPVEGTAIIPDDLKVVFVVNKGSASASEVVSAVLQERGEITVVGENTFGKNTVQQRFPLSNGGALKLTIARWVTPGGLDFGGVGVTPDVDLAVDELDAEALVVAVLAAA